MKFPINRACPVTGSGSHRVLAYIPAKAIAAGNATYRPSFSEILNISPDDEFPIVEDSAGFAFAGWLPPEDFLHRLYEEVVDHSKTITQRTFYRVSLLDYAGIFLAIAECRNPSNKSPRLLDYGCGYGLFGQILSGGDIHAIGYEPSGRRRGAAAPGFTSFGDLDQVANDGPFDLIVCTQVLEHVPDPRAALAFMRKNAAPGALLGISVPNCKRSHLNTWLHELAGGGRLSPVINPWEHLNYFSPESLRRLLAEEGFKVVNDVLRSRAARNACLQFGEPAASLFANSLRVFKRAATAAPSTTLICETS